METTSNSKLRSARSLGEAEDGELSRDTTNQIEDDMLFSVDNKGTEDLRSPEDENSTIKEEFKVSSREENNTILEKDEDVLPKLNMLGSSTMDMLDDAVNERSCDKSVNSELPTTSLAGNEDNDCIPRTTEQISHEGNKLSPNDGNGIEGNTNSTQQEEFKIPSTDDRENSLHSSIVTELDNAASFVGGAESLPEDVNSTKKKEIFQENNTTFKKDGETVLSKLKVADTSAVNTLGSVMKENHCSRSAAGLSLELEDLKGRYQKMTKERNSLQQKVFEMQSEFCSVEIERDLEKETSRYLEEQISSLNSSLSLKENELESLRKRYKLLNEGFLNSETLREGLERDISELTKVIRELEERLELSEGMLKDNKDNLEVKTAELSAENAEEKAKLETEVATLNETLRKEKTSKTNLEEMFTNIEKERSLLLKEVEELRSEHQKQINEVTVLRDLLHDKNKQEQLNQLQEQQLQRKLEEKQKQQNKEVIELQESSIHLSSKISLIQDENKTLEDELYQQLAVLENLQVENKSLTGARKELREISDKLKVLGVDGIEQLIIGYSELQEGKKELERKISQLKREISICQISKEKAESNSGGTSMDCPHLGVHSTKSSCVPRSEYLKLKFQLKFSTEEIKTLKQASERKIMKEKAVSSGTKQEHRSRKHENRMAKKWLNTMKDSMNAFVNEDEDFSHAQYGTVLLENQLHETNIRVDALQHELDISRKENAVLDSTNKKREEEIEVLKRRLVQSQENQTTLLKDLKTKLGKAEKELEDEVQKGIGMEGKIAYLEEQNQDMCIELEKLKEKFQSSQKEKERVQNELESFKHDILKNFGSLNIQSVSKSLNSVKEKSVEYVKIIETNKSNLLKLTQDLNSLQQVNTILREELNEVRIQLEKKDEVISKKSLNESISEKRESDRLKAVIQALESSKQNEAELLAMYTKEKRELDKLHEELMNSNSELEEAKILLSEKEKECETTSRIMRELEASCEVYEAEFEKSTTVQEQENLDRGTKENELSPDESQEEELSESGSDSTAENFREMQEALQERMAMKVKRLQNRLEETLAALSSCQKLNVDLQKRLHDVENKILEKEEVDGRTPDKEFLETILDKFSEKEREIQEILQTNLSGPRDGKQENRENNSDELLSPYKETIKQLKIDNAKKEVHLVEAKERIAELEEKLAIYQHFREDNTRILDCSDNDMTFENASITIASKEDLIGADIVVATNDNLKEELDCMTAKYANLKAAFEGCLRRLKTMEGGEDGEEEETAGTVNMVERYKSSDVIEGMVVPKFISPLQGKKTETAENYTGFQESANFENYQDMRAIKSSSFSEISCAFKESDSDADSIGSDCMVIELTLTENDLDSSEISETCNEFLHERLDHENEFGRLRANIIELEKLNSTTTNEIHRVKQSSFKERTELENKLRSLEKLNSMMKAKLTAVEAERDSLEERGNQSDIRHSEAKQELQRVKIFTSNEQETSENTIKGLKDQENTSKKRMVKLEMEKDELRMKTEELQGQLQDCFQEAKRVKVEYYSQGENFRNVFKEFEHEIEVHKKGKERYDFRMSELNQKVCVLENEIRKSKDDNLEHEESIKKFEGVILNLKKQNTDLKCEKEDAFVKNRELQHRNEILIKRQEQDMASILKEKEDLENKSIQLQTTITTLEETLGREKTRSDDLTCKFRIENKESESLLLGERKAFEDTTRQLQEKIMILKKEMKDLNFRKDSSESMMKELEEKNDLLDEEREEDERRIKTLLDERQSLEDTGEELQIMIAELKERFMVENTGKDNKISLIQNENLFLKVESEKIESQVLSCVDEIQRIKSLSFNERQKLETVVTNLHETVLSMKKVIGEDKQAMEHLNLMRNDFEDKCIYLQKELERVKICSFKESELENKIEKLTEALFSIEIKFEDLKKEKDHLLLKEKESEEIIWKLQEELQRIKVYAFEERQNMVAKVENYNVLVKESKTNFEYQILRDRQISSLKLTVSELDDLRRTLENDKYVQHEEICAFKINVENLRNEIKRLENNVIDYEHQISTLGRNLSELDEDKRSLETKVLQRDEEILSVKKMAEELQNEKKHLQQKIVEQDEQVSLLQLNVSSLEEKTENDMLQSSKEKSTAKILVANLEKQKKLLKDDIVKCNSEITLLKRKVSQFEEEREYLATSTAEKDRELSEFRITVGKIEDEKNHLKESNAKQNNEISLLEKKVSQLQEQRENFTNSTNVKANEMSDLRTILEKLENERNTLREDNIKQRNEMSLLGTTVAEIEKEKECLANVVAKQDDELSSFKITLETLRGEKKDLQDDIKNRDIEILALKERVSKLIEEKDSHMQNAVKKEEELSMVRFNTTELHEGRKILEESVLKRDSEIALSESKISQLEKKKESLFNDIAARDEELSVMKVAVGNLEERKNVLEQDILERDNDISLQETSIGRLEKDKESLANDIAKKDEELIAMKLTVENLQVEKKALEEHNISQVKEISLIQTTLVQLQSKNDNDIVVQDEEMCDMKVTVENLQNEKKAIEEHSINRENDISLFETSLVELKSEKESMANEIALRDEELSLIKISVQKREEVNKFLEDVIAKRDGHISQQEAGIAILEKEKEILANNIAKKDEELSVMKVTVETLQNEKEAIEENNFRRGNEISLLETTRIQLEKKNESLTNDIGKRNEELFACKETIEKFEAQKKDFENDLMGRDNEIILLKELNLSKLQEEKDSFANDIEKRDNELLACKEIIEKLEAQKKDFENDIMEQNSEIFLLKEKMSELEEEKESSANDIINKDEKLSTFDVTVEKLKNEKKALEDDIMKRGNEISLLESRLAQLQKEKESFMNDLLKNDKELSVLKMSVEKLQHEKKVLEEDIMKRDGVSSMQEANVDRLEKEKQTLSDDLVEKNKELSGIRIGLEKLETERKSLEDSVVKSDDQILILNDKISKLQDEKESLANNMVDQDTELSTLKITVEQLENEKKATEDNILKRDSEILSLQSNVFNLQEENETLTDSIAEKNEKLSAYIENIEKLDYEKNSLQSLVMKERGELLSLRNDFNEITEVKAFLEVDIQKRDEELLLIKETLHNLQDEYKLLENNNVEHNEIISHYTMKIESYREEIGLLKNNLQKVTTEKENVENKMKEFNEKSKCDEDDFDKLIAGYLQEIDSWKKSFGGLEEEMSVLRNEIERLQYEKRDLENIFEEMSESERVNEEKFQENIKIYHEDIDSWKVKVQDLESDVEVLRKTVQELERESESKKLEINRTNEEKGKNSKLYQDMVIKFQKERENSEKQWVVEKEKEIGNLRFELETKLQMMESQFSTKEKELHDRNVSMEQLKDDVSQLNDVVSKKDEEVLDLKSQVVELEERTFEANNKIHGIQQQYDRKEQELKLSVEEFQEKARKLTEIVSEKEERVFTLENEIKGLSQLDKELEESKLRFIQAQKKYEDELRNLQNTQKSFEAKELAEKNELKLMENEVNHLRSELSALQQQNLEDTNSEKTVNNNTEKSREHLRVLLADIDETTKIKVSLEEELRLLQSKLEQHSEEKIKLEMEVFCLKEITEELTKGKMTLLEEIARLSDQKKEGQELLNSEFSRLRISNNELQNNREKIEKENSELIVQISSLKVTLATVQSAYEQTQDEIKNHRMRLDEAGRREKQHNQEQEKLDEKSKKIEVEIKYLEERNRSVTVENKELSSSLNETRKRLESLEDELQTIKGENVLLLQRLKQQESGDNAEGLDSGRSSTQASALRKKLKEFRGKLSEEKKQRELHEFEIKNLNEKVERIVKKEKENEVQLESSRKKFLEVKTERDGLLMDLDSLNKRKKKDVEGYTSRIDTLEDELRLLREKESKKADGKQTKETVNVLNEEKKILELRLTSNQERHQREVTELKRTLGSLQNRYTTELKRFETTETANKNEILKLRKSLTSIEREHESQRRELEQLRANLVASNGEKEKIENVLTEKNSEVNKWKKEALNDKAEIRFLRGSLNILEKEGLTSKPTETPDRVTN